MIEFYTIAIIAVLAAISPGPDFVVVAKNAFCRSRRAALICAAGVSSAILVHTVYCVLGLAVIISKSILLFNIIKYCGAAYLIYIGIKSLTAKKTPITIEQDNAEQQSIANSKVFLEGFFTNMLNPKCTLFMLSVFTLVVNPETSKLIQFSYGVEIATIALVWFSLLSYGITTSSVHSRLNRLQSSIMKFTGAVLVVLGIRIALDKTHG